jgi:translation initiation factor IF-3
MKGALFTKVLNHKMRVNEMIRYPKVRVILDSNGEQLGVMSSRDALAKAKELQLDLIEVAPNAVPPVCKIMDFGKLKYELSKKEKEDKKKQHVIITKTVNISPNIAENDLLRKINEVKRFLEQNFRVMFCVEMEGRQATHPELAYKHIDRMKENIDEKLVLVDKPQKTGQGHRTKITISLQKKT